MPNAADGVVTVLDFLQRMYDVGTDVTPAHGQVLATLNELGIGGFDAGDEEFFLTVGLALKALLRHANTDPSVMFADTKADLESLGRALDADSES